MISKRDEKITTTTNIIINNNILLMKMYWPKTVLFLNCVFKLISSFLVWEILQHPATYFVVIISNKIVQRFKHFNWILLLTSH